MVALLPLSRRLMDTEDNRRLFPRKQVRGRAEGRRLDHSIVARRQPRLSFELCDLSAGGLCAMSDTPVLTGERINVLIPPREAQLGWGAYGTVVRCQPTALGYRVAVEFDSFPAA